MKLVIGGDHAGYEYKKQVIKHLAGRNIEVIDKGPYSGVSVDYPDFVHPVCHSLVSGTVELGILICGSGNGVAITANKYESIRCGLCWTPELAALTRSHNNANILALPARFIDINTAIDIVNAFIDTPFEGGRHTRRVEKIIPSSPIKTETSC